MNAKRGPLPICIQTDIGAAPAQVLALGTWSGMFVHGTPSPRHRLCLFMLGSGMTLWFKQAAMRIAMNVRTGVLAPGHFVVDCAWYVWTYQPGRGGEPGELEFQEHA